MKIEIDHLMTEQTNPNTAQIDQLSTQEMLTLINAEDRLVADVVAQEIPHITLAVDRIVEALGRGGRLVYIGAGTSGRLGVLDASECPPTFGVDANLVIGLIAGGDGALRKSIEGAEDQEQEAVRQLQEIHFSFPAIVFL